MCAAPRSSSSISPYTGRPYTERYATLKRIRSGLPIFSKKEEFIGLLNENRIVVLVGETGCGKTTQVPQFLVEAGYSKGGKHIGCTQPRRVAAMSVAARVAQEMDVTLGDEVGYNIRFDDCTTPKTFLKYLTDGMLLRETVSDPLLSRYSVILLDEAHERTLATDVLFGLIKDIMKKRSDLKLVVMSATLDTIKFKKYFENAPLISVPGRQSPVSIIYSPEPLRDYVEAAIETTVQIHLHEPPGDILVFLTGEEEIEEACQKIRSSIDTMSRPSALQRATPQLPDAVIIPLYSSLPPNMQQRIFDPPPPARHPGAPVGRKIIVATNVAETSITIDGIVYVVDTGFSKQKLYNPRTRVESLIPTPISKASAKQRAGRAGRTRPGKCFRLFTEASFNDDLEEDTPPEILRSNMCSVVLELLKIGVTDLAHFDLMDPPAPETLMRALEELHHLGAINAEVQLTDVGHKMSQFPVDPQLSKALIEAQRFHCTSEILTIAAIISAPQVFFRPREAAREADEAKKKFIHEDGDHMTLLNVYHAWLTNSEDPGWCHTHFLNLRALKAAQSIRSQLQRLVERLHIALESPPFVLPDYYTAIRRALTAGFFMQVACVDEKGRYRTVLDQQTVALHPSTVLKGRPTWVIYNEFVLTQKCFIRTVTPILCEWLAEYGFAYFDVDKLPECRAKQELLLVFQRSAK
jgi:pre-mRNA-splicing factor ATP-dependent RNA helicase DHX15/PRP43